MIVSSEATCNGAHSMLQRKSTQLVLRLGNYLSRRDIFEDN